MKIAKTLVALALVLTTVLAMAVPAFAATKDEAYNAAAKTGAPSHHLAELKNYLNTVSFTAEEYDQMVKAANRVENIVTPFAQSKFGVNPSALTESQKEAVFKALPGQTRRTVLGILTSLGSNVGVKVELDLIDYSTGYSITATDKNGKVVTSSSNKPVVDTSVDYTTVTVVTAVVLTALIGGVVLVSRKVRA